MPARRGLLPFWIEDMERVDDRTALVRGLRLHYRAWPRAAEHDAPTVVLVHGLGSSCRIWDLTAPLIADRFPVLALDQRGHGLSEQPDDGYDLETVSGDLHTFLSAVGIDRPAVLVGHSWGASVVLACAARWPESALGVALVDGGMHSFGERWTWEEALERLTPPDLDGIPWADLRDRVGRHGVNTRDERVESVLRSLFHVDADGRIRRRFLVSNHLKVVRSLWEERPLETLKGVACPVLVMPARQESDDPEMRSAKEHAAAVAIRHNPGARVRWFDETIHDVPLQRPFELADEIVAFGTGLATVRSHP